MSHTPVLLQEVLQYLDPQPGKTFIDGTANGGGHTLALAQAGARVIAIELDTTLYEKLCNTVRDAGYENAVTCRNDSYANLEQARESDASVDGVLLDLGFSSWQMDESGRGFSFQRDEPLDMRYDTNSESRVTNNETAADILNSRSEKEIASILQEFGEEKFDGRIARAIVEARPIYTTSELVKAIESVVHRVGKIHPATRTFQALRIVVNHELENVQLGLEAAVNVLKPGGRLAVITFHSLEDRIVKHFFQSARKQGALSILTKKPVRPGQTEVTTNKRSRSAKLRVAERTAPIM